MEVALILVSLLGLMYFTYRGYSIILAAPLFALLAAFASQFSLVPTYSELFMTKAAEYIKNYFSIFLLGAIFGKAMEESGMAYSVAKAIVERLGKEHAILAVLLACAALTYGGVSVFAVVFVMYPFAAVLFKEANIPKRLIPATLWMGTFSFAMASFPGAPQIQNIIPTTFYGTTTWAAPVTGVLSGLLLFGLGWWWLAHRHGKLAAVGEGYGNYTINEPKPHDEEELLHWFKAMLPLLVVVLLNLILNNPFQWEWAYHWNSALLEPFKPLKLTLVSGSVERAQPIWSLNVALVTGVALAVWLGRKRILERSGITGVLNGGTSGSLLAVMNTASGFAFGSVIASVSGFGAIKSFLMQIKIGEGPLVSEAITTTLLAGITGSASGGITIALGMLGADYLAWAQSVNMSPEILHRIVTLASAGLDSLPHNGGLLTVMAVCGLTHKQSYYDIFILTLMKTLVPFLFIALYSATGWL